MRRPRRINQHPIFALLVLLHLLLAIPTASRAEPDPDAAREPVLRIGLRTEAAHSLISCDGRVRVWRRGSGLRGTVLGPGIRFRVMPTPVAHSVWEEAAGEGAAPDCGILLAEYRVRRLGVFVEDLIFEPISPGQPIRADGHAYRGEIIVRATGPKTLTLINAVHIEDYLRGVVPPEVGSADDLPEAVLQAQAIAARSYSIFYLGRRAEYGFDLFANPEDQVYEGIGVETEAATEAISRTRGIMALYGGAPIRANYCSTCGGATEASGSVWPGEDFPYLRPVRDQDEGDILCEGSPRFRWSESWGCREFEEIILRHLPEEVPEARAAGSTRIIDIDVVRRSPSRRVEMLEIETDAGRYQVRGDRIRWVLRPTSGRPLWSTLFGSLKRESEGGACRITLEGAGYGHGVGMCQTGAIELARRGRSAPEILRHYYRGIEFERWW